jgi:hypothetical protein
LSFSYPERRPTFFSLVLPGAQVKHFNDALNELVQSQEEFLLQWRDSQHRRGTPRNSSDVQSSRSFSPSQFPWPAQHFNTQEAVPSVSDQAIADVRGLLSRQDAAFLITFLPSTHMLVVDNTKEFLKYVMLFITNSDRTAIFITLPRPLGLGFETLIFRP